MVTGDREERTGIVRERLSANMRIWMGRSGKDAKKLAEDSGLSLDMIYKIMRCETPVSTDRLTHIADALEVRPAVLLLPVE